jgi:hypothetical protein
MKQQFMVERMQDYRRGNSRMDTSFCELEVCNLSQTQIHDRCVTSN